MTPNKDIEEQISDFIYNTRITSDNASDEQKLRKFIKSLLDQQRQEIIEELEGKDKYHDYPWKTKNNVCSWCGEAYNDPSKHSNKHDYGT